MRIIAIIVVPRNRRPTAGMAWLLAIFFIPFLGILFFLLIGNPKLPKHRREKQAEVDRYIRESTHGVERVSDSAAVAGLVRGRRPAEPQPRLDAAHRSNSASLIGDYQASLDAMADAIGGAKRYVHVEFYILALRHHDRRFFDALGEAVARGVEVRVLLDHVASRTREGLPHDAQAPHRDGRRSGS